MGSSDKLLAGINDSSNQWVSAIIDTAKLPNRRHELEKVPQIEKPIIGQRETDSRKKKL